MKMKSLAGWVAALTLIGCSCAESAHGNIDGAKGLFFEQMDRPTEKMNTGVQFWIELDRNGQTSRADNRAAFKSGDKIRFHVKPNIDGYAYILLRSGSRGEQAQLFPDVSKQESNRISRGKEMVLPPDGTLDFDANPGIEKMTILISRSPIETKSYLGSAADGSAPRVVMLASGSKDLIPTQVLVSYMTPSKIAPLPSAGATGKEAKDGAAKGATIIHIKGGDITKDKYQPHKEMNPKNTAPKHSIRAVNKPLTKVAGAKTNDNSADAQSSVVTVVYKDPNGVLAADISLEHM
jgi:Domain of unknown function (DUF4384)